jgi:F-type H+-transporting ATPase subunit delta
MRGASRQSLAAARERLESVMTSDGTDRATVGEELFTVTDVLADNAGLRRALTDPSRTGEAKADLVQRLLGSHVSAGTGDLLAGLVRGRWSAAPDLVDAVETLGVTALLAAAEASGRLEAAEDDLFRFSRSVAADAGLRDAFSNRSEGADRKAELVRALLSAKVGPEALRLATQAAVRPRGMRTEQVLEQYVEAAAARRRQLIAHVTAAVPLSTAQRDRLATALGRWYDRDIQLTVDVDPEVLGGIRVQVGGEVIDSTVLARLEEARQRLAG